jgi:SAM-dependent methyltransferase
MGKHLFFIFFFTLIPAFLACPMRDFYDRMDEECSSRKQENKYKDQLFVAMRLFTDYQIAVDGTFLVIETGSGALAATIASDFVPQGRVIAVAQEAERVCVAQQEYKRISNLEFHHMDDIFLATLKDFDYVLLIDGIGSDYRLNEIETVISLVARNLKPYGHFIACLTTKYPSDYRISLLRSVQGVTTLERLEPGMSSCGDLSSNFIREIFAELQERMDRVADKAVALSSSVGLIQACKPIQIYKRFLS